MRRAWRRSATDCEVVQELRVAAFAAEESDGVVTRRERDEVNEIAVRLFVAKARVDLVSDSGAVEEAAGEVLDEFTNPTPKDDPTTRKFRVAARNDIETAGK